MKIPISYLLEAVRPDLVKKYIPQGTPNAGIYVDQVRTRVMGMDSVKNLKSVVEHQAGLYDKLVDLLAYLAIKEGDDKVAHVAEILHDLVSYREMSGFVNEIMKLGPNVSTASVDEISGRAHARRTRGLTDEQRETWMDESKYEIVRKYDNGLMWVKLDRSECEILGKLAQHCGNVGGSSRNESLYVLRNGDLDVYVTISVMPDGHIVQSKANKNQKIPEKLYPYVIDMLRHEHVKGIHVGMYDPHRDFHLSDLMSTEHEHEIDNLRNEKPGLYQEEYDSKIIEISRALKSGDISTDDVLKMYKDEDIDFIVLVKFVDPGFDLCIEAVANDSKNYGVVPRKYRNDLKFNETVFYENMKTFRYMPDECKSTEMCADYLINEIKYTNTEDMFAVPVDKFARAMEEVENNAPRGRVNHIYGAINAEFWAKYEDEIRKVNPNLIGVYIYGSRVISASNGEYLIYEQQFSLNDPPSLFDEVGIYLDTEDYEYASLAERMIDGEDDVLDELESSLDVLKVKDIAGLSKGAVWDIIADGDYNSDFVEAYDNAMLVALENHYVEELRWKTGKKHTEKGCWIVVNDNMVRMYSDSSEGVGNDPIEGGSAAAPPNFDISIEPPHHLKPDPKVYLELITKVVENIEENE